MSLIPALTDEDKKKVHRLIATVGSGDSDRMDANLECGARCSTYTVGKVVRVDIYKKN